MSSHSGFSDRYKRANNLPKVIEFNDYNKAYNISDIIKQKNATGKIKVGEGIYGIEGDFKKKDLFTEEYKKLLSRCLKNFKNDDDIKELLNKKTWTDDDRDTWEYKLNMYVYDEMQKHPIFKGYRPEKAFEQRSLNSITPTNEFDCEHIHLVKGMVMQEIENNLLSEKNEGIKKPTGYYYTLHRIFESEDGITYTYGGHATLVSGTTFATLNYREYYKNTKHRIGENYDINSFKKGEMIFGDNYGESHIVLDISSSRNFMAHIIAKAGEIFKNDINKKFEFLRKEFEAQINEANKSGGGITKAEYEAIKKNMKEEYSSRFLEIEQQYIEKVMKIKGIDYVDNRSMPSQNVNEDYIKVLGKNISVHFIEEEGSIRNYISAVSTDRTRVTPPRPIAIASAEDRYRSADR
jgi:hypothetical protein